MLTTEELLLNICARSKVVDCTETQVGDASGPYIVTSIKLVLTSRAHNKRYDQNADCKCGHPYHRHFDPYENMDPVGCKYCDCFTFEPKT